MAELAQWDSFYGIVGSSAGALIGLQFVVLTLIAQRPPTQMPGAGATFLTPTIVHFSMVLLISALSRAPWQDFTLLSVLWGVIGLCGMVYVAIVGWRMGRQTGYQPFLEDWLCCILLPWLAYAGIVVAAFAVFSFTRTALFGIGAMTLVLLFIGIHNAWDTVAYHVFVSRRTPEAGSP